ncbi:MAG: acyltransferase [Frankiales bacterium]|nr:acyltransferase [Frankiales bacterium]
MAHRAAAGGRGELLIRHSAALTGLRGIAVALVVWLHVTFQTKVQLLGGFFGVDVFFVLSGMLITALLVAEHRGRGGVSMRAFYARRGLRLLPALAVCLVLALALRLVAGPVGTGLLREVVGALLYVQNWLSIAAPSQASYLDHLWSLSIEEQFYLVWPLTLVLLLRRGARPERIAVATLTVAVLVMAVRWGVHEGHPGHDALAFKAYYLDSFARLDQILLGVTVGLLPSAVWSRVGRLAPLAAVGLVVIVARGRVRADWVYEWGLTAVAVCAAVLVAAAAAGSGVVPRLLSWRPLVGLGTISYGLYLYHYPVVLALGKTGWSDPVRVLLGLTFPLVLAVLSWRYVEGPALRLKHRFERVPT